MIFILLKLFISDSTLLQIIQKSSFAHLMMNSTNNLLYFYIQIFIMSYLHAVESLEDKYHRKF